MLPPLLFDSMIFSREDLGALRSAYGMAAADLGARLPLDAPSHERLARVVVEAGWAYLCNGRALPGNEAALADEAATFLNEQLAYALCA
jgi:hypothetical protein